MTTSHVTNSHHFWNLNSKVSFPIFLPSSGWNQGYNRLQWRSFSRIHCIANNNFHCVSSLLIFSSLSDENIPKSNTTQKAGVAIDKWETQATHGVSIIKTNRQIPYNPSSYFIENKPEYRFFESEIYSISDIILKRLNHKIG